MASGVFGWDLLYRTIENEIKNSQDVLLALVHLTLISNEFRCIGIGDSKNIDGNEPQTETLPRGWNDSYSLRYVFQGRLYILKATNLDDAVMFNLVRVDERTVSLLQLDTRMVVSHTGGLLETMVPEAASIIDRVKKQLISKVVISKRSRESSSQTETPTTSYNPLRDDRSNVYPSAIPAGGFYQEDPFGVGQIGQRDLNPIPLPIPGQPPIGTGGGGGMLFQPPRRPFQPQGPEFGMPPGAIPPGARFDPFRPPDVDRFPRRPHRPDNDEMPPPGFDDMFM